METKIKIENCPIPFCVIHTKERTKNIDTIASKIEGMDINGNQSYISAWDGNFCIKLKQNEIYRVYSMDKKVFVETAKETLLLKLRLYQFEEYGKDQLWTKFVRISNSDFVNIDFIEKFDLNFTGLIKIIMKNKTEVNVSRRYMGKIKDQIILSKGKIPGKSNEK